MKTLHRYLLREVLATLVLTVGVFTAVLLMGNAMKEVLALVVRGQASLMGVGKAFVLLIPCNFLLVTDGVTNGDAAGVRAV